ncbi:MAG: MATE family efflux transporter [Bacteroidetes bacterium]|nr:MATE family efflux transporter [Bacteroidota bacterium]
MSIPKIFLLIRDALQGKDHDYTQGSIKVAIFLLAVPMVLELCLESVFALVDMFFVGKLGKNAIATVGLTESVITIIYSVAIGLSTAATALVARKTGEKNEQAASQGAMQSILLGVMISIILGIIGMYFAADILRFMGANNEIIREGAGFTRIMMGSSIFIVLLFLLNGIFRGAGNAAIAMKSLWLASAINIVLCPICIYTLDFGLEGAAIATAIGRASGVVFQIFQLNKGSKQLPMVSHYFKPHIPTLKVLFTLAWPATFQFVIASASWIILAKIVAETGGSEASAGYQIAMRNVVFFILPAWGLSNAAATLVGQNLGAKQIGRAEASVRLAAIYNMFFMGIVTIIFMLFSNPIIRFFTTDEAVIAYGVLALRIIGTGYVFYGLGMVIVQSLNGAGDTKSPTIIHFVGFWLFQIPLAYLLANYFNWGPQGAFIAIPVAETLIALIAYLVYRSGKWKLIDL